MSVKRHCQLSTVLLTIAVALIAQPIPTTTAKSIAPSQQLSSSSNGSSSSPILTIPNQIDDDDILKEYGRYLIGIMNQNVDPCEDFYEYACGNWKNAEVVPEKFRNKPKNFATKVQMEEMLANFLKNITEEQLKEDTAESKAKLFYSSCLKTNNDMERGFKEIWEMEEFTKEVVLSSNNETLDWINRNFLSPYGVYPLLPLDVNYHIDNKTYELIISLPQSMLSDTDIVDVKNLTRDFKIENDDLKKSFTKELEDMIEFEKNLIAHANKRNETEDLPFAKFLLQHKDDAFNWTLYFDVAFNGTKKPDPMVSYNIEDIGSLVRFLNKTDLETLRNYVKWRTLLKFYNLWKSRDDHESVESFCLENTKKYFNVALTPWLIENTIDADRREGIFDIAKQIRQTFYDLMDSYNWLDDETKSNAKTKLSAMDVIVGYTDDMRHEVINHIYTDLRVTDDWFENLFALECSKIKMRMFSINETNIPPLIENLDRVNAHYIRYLNSVIIQIGYTQLPLYHPHLPVSMKFGGIGSVFGHETVHGFDSGNYKFDYNGEERNWWTESSLQNFQERYRCLESQYNKYFFRGVPTNGTQTSKENMADNGGIRFAYTTYMNSYGRVEGEHTPITGLNFTNKELFFIQYAQHRCSGEDDASKINYIKTNVHAVFEDRVHGPLSNMPEFSEVFKCKLGSNMNPIKKCVIW